jgi:hypothetical protein
MTPKHTIYKGVLKTLIISMILPIALMQCKTKETVNRTVSVMDYVGESKRLKKLATEDLTQRFTFKTTDQIIVKGSKGTKITIDPGNLESEDGGDVTGEEITINLIELLDQYDLAKADAQTISNGELLISGGAYWLDIATKEKKLKIKKGKSIKVEFPRLSNDEMSLFYGQRDSLGQMNWLKTDVKLSKRDNGSSIADLSPLMVENSSFEDMDTTHVDEKTLKTRQKIKQERRKNRSVEEKLYQAIELEQLGWVNVDRFYEMTNNRDLLFAFNPRDSVTSAIIYMIFEDLNSVLTTTYFAVNDTVLNNAFRGIPSKGRVKLIGVVSRNGEIFASEQLLDLQSESQIEFRLEKTFEERLADIFK